MSTGVKRLFLLIIMFLFTAINVYAKDNSLSGITVQYSDNQGYNIVLRTDMPAQINKSVDENGDLLLTLKETLPAESFDIVYDNAEETSNIIVQKKNHNTKILIQGDNISQAKIYLKELSTGVMKPIESNKGFISLISGKNISAISILSIILLLIINFRAKSKRQKLAKAGAQQLKSKIIANTLRKKNLIQSKNIPSINYKVNTFATVPNDFIINQNEYSEPEKIKKAS